MIQYFPEIDAVIDLQKFQDVMDEVAKIPLLERRVIEAAINYQQNHLDDENENGHPAHYAVCEAVEDLLNARRIAGMPTPKCN